MKIWKRILGRIFKLEPEFEDGRWVAWSDLCLNPTLIDQVLRPEDIIAYPEMAVAAAISKGIQQGRQDPFCLLKEMLQNIGVEFNPRWDLIARAGMFQYRMGEFTKRIGNMKTEALDKNIPVNTISYRVCIERTLEELHDELMQINGLLDGMPITESDLREAFDGLKRTKGDYIDLEKLQGINPLLEWSPDGEDEDNDA